MNQPATTLRSRSCIRCGFLGESADSVCPQCKGRLETSSSIRLRGLVLTLCGVFLITVMGFISLWTLQVFSGDVSGTHFTGTEQQKVIIMGLFASLLLLGLVSLIVGIYQLATGRRKRIFVWASLAVAFLVVIGGSLVLWLF